MPPFLCCGLVVMQKSTCKGSRLSGLRVGTAFVQDAFAIDDDGIGFLKPSAKSILAIATLAAPLPIIVNFTFSFFLAYQLQGIDQAGQSDSGRALLVIVPDGDFHFLAQGIQDTEALGVGKVFQVDAAKRRLQVFYGLDYLVFVFSTEADGDGIDTAQVFEQECFTFHDGKASLGTDITQPEDPGAIRNYGYGIPLVGIVVSFFLVGLYCLARGRYTRCIPDSEIVKVADFAFGKVCIFPL